MIETEVKKATKGMSDLCNLFAESNSLLTRLCNLLESSGLEVPADNDDRVPTEIPADRPTPTPVVNGIVPNTAPSPVAPPQDDGNGAIAPGIIPTPGSPPPPTGPMLSMPEAPAAPATTPPPGQPTGNLDGNVMLTLAKSSQILNDPLLVNKLCQQLGIKTVGEASPEQAEWMTATAKGMVQAAGKVF